MFDFIEYNFFLEKEKPLNFRLPANMTELGRQYFDNTQSIQLFNGTGNMTGTLGVQIIPLRAYAQSIFTSFTSAYDNSSVPPPQFFLIHQKKVIYH